MDDARHKRSPTRCVHSSAIIVSGVATYVAILEADRFPPPDAHPPALWLVRTPPNSLIVVYAGLSYNCSSTIDVQSSTIIVLGCVVIDVGLDGFERCLSVDEQASPTSRKVRIDVHLREYHCARIY